MSDYALFLGCVIPNRYPGIEAAMRKIAPSLGITLYEMEGASCCPAPGVTRSFDPQTWLTLAARNICIAEALGKNMLTMCNGCYASLKEANIILKNDSAKREAVNKVLSEVGRSFRGSIDVKHIVEVLCNEVGLEKIKSIPKRQLNLKAAVHYGCHILKPSELRGWKSHERPTFLDELVTALGLESVEYQDKMMCCGAGGGVRSGVPEVGLDMTREKMRNITRAQADVIVNCCPLCHLQFDRGQVEIEQNLGENLGVPVLHYLQLLGICTGLTLNEVGAKAHNVSLETLASKM